MWIKDIIALFMLAALWGGSFLFMRVISPALGPVVTAALRVSIAGAALLVYAAATQQMPTFRGYWRRFLTVGALNAAIPFALIATAELHLPASLASILNAMTPLCTAVVAALWLREPLTAKQGVGLLLGIVGVVVLVGGSTLPADTTTLLAVCASLGATVSYGVVKSYIKVAFTSGEPPLSLAIGQQVGASILLLPFAVPLAVVNGPTMRVTPSVVVSVIGVALLSTSVAYLLFYYLMQRVGPTRTASVTFLIPAFGLLWGVLFLGETVQAGTLLGLAIILSSVTLVTGARFRVPTTNAKASPRAATPETRPH